MFRDDSCRARQVWHCRAIAVGLSLLLAGLSCASRQASGPPFEDRAPSNVGVMLFVYRADRVPTRGMARLRLPGGFEAKLANREYAWFEVPAGLHVLKLQFRGFPWAWGWDQVPFQAGFGETLYLRLSADVQRTHQRAGHLEDDNMGPRNERYGVTLLRSFQASRDALPELRQSRLSPDLVNHLSSPPED